MEFTTDTKFVIVDLDNCISNDLWRHKFILPQKPHGFAKYAHYHQLAGFDEARNLDRVQGHDVIVMTARPVFFRPITEHWLKTVARIEPHAIMMRNDNDHRPSAIVKHSMLLQLEVFWGIQKQDIAVAYDDRPDVVEMFRKTGVKAERLFIHQQEIGQ